MSFDKAAYWREKRHRKLKSIPRSAWDRAAELRDTIVECESISRPLLQRVGAELDVRVHSGYVEYRVLTAFHCDEIAMVCFAPFRWSRGLHVQRVAEMCSSFERFAFHEPEAA